MRGSWQRWWLVGKVVLTVVILACVGWQFAHILLDAELWHADWHVRPDWAVVAGLLYLLSLGFSAFFWYRLLKILGQQPSFPATLRAYYVGQLARYVPGKVVPVVVRARLLSGPGVGQGMAVLIFGTTHEANAMARNINRLHHTVQGTLLESIGRYPAGETYSAMEPLALLWVHIVFVDSMLVAGKLASAFRDGSSVPPPRLKSATLAEGLAVTACGWGLQGASLWALLQGLSPQPWSLEAWLDCTAFVALATLAGFVVLTVPGGLGVRELVLQQLLTAELTSALGARQAALTAVVAVLLLRLIWVAAELAAAGAFYWMPRHAAVTSPADQGVAS